MRPICNRLASSGGPTARSPRLRRPVLIVLAAAAVTVLVLAGCGDSDDGGGSDSSDSWLVGMPLGFTGALATYAPSQEEGIKLAVKDVNQDPPAGRKIEVLREDTESKENVAISAFEKLVREDQVDAILGPTGSGSAFAADPVADEAGVPVIAPANTAEGIPDIGECVFRVSAEETLIIPTAVKAAVPGLGIDSAAVIYASSDEFNDTGGKTLISAFEDEGVEVTGDATFSTGQTNFQAQLTELLEDDPDALAIAAFTPEAILVVRQARSLGFDGPIIGNKGFSGEGVIDEVGRDAGTLVVGAQYHQDAATTGNEDFVKAYEQEYGRDPDEFAALGYDAVKFLALGLADAGPDAGPSDVCTSLQGVKELDGLTGKLEFTDNGDVKTEGVALVSENGKPFQVFH